MEGRFNDCCDSDELWEYIDSNTDKSENREYEEFQEEKPDKYENEGGDKIEALGEEGGIESETADLNEEEFIDTEIEAFKNDSKFNSLTDYEFFKLNQAFPDCGIKNIKDLAKSENLYDVLNIWRKGIPLSQAYAAANIGSIVNKKTVAAKQSAINQMNSKSHLRATISKTGNNVFVPNEIMNEYKGFFPDWSESKIAEDYRKRIK